MLKIVDGSGNVVGSYTYDAWGKVLSVTGTIAEINPIRYRSYYYDAETGLYYLQSRYYDPEIGRFISADDTQYLGASGTALGYNLFGYCENNPVNAADESGTFFSIKVYAAAAVTAAVIGAISKIISNYANGRRGRALFSGVLGSAVGNAVNAVLLMRLFRLKGTGMVIAAFCAGAAQAVFDFLENILVTKKANWGQLGRDALFNSAANLAGNYLGSKMVYVNGSWFQPRKIASFFTKSYGKRLIAQTGIGSVLNLIIDLVRGRIGKKIR